MYVVYMTYPCTFIGAQNNNKKVQHRIKTFGIFWYSSKIKWNIFETDGYLKIE